MWLWSIGGDSMAERKRELLLSQRELQTFGLRCGCILYEIAALRSIAFRFIRNDIINSCLNERQRRSFHANVCEHFTNALRSIHATQSVAIHLHSTPLGAFHERSAFISRNAQALQFT